MSRIIDADDDAGDRAAYTRGKRGRPQKGNKNPESQETEESQASLTAALGGMEVEEEEEVIQPISPKVGRLSRQSSGNIFFIHLCFALLICLKFLGTMVQYLVAGLAVKVPRMKKIFAQPVFIYKNVKSNRELVDAEIASIKAKYPRIEMERFNGTADYPSSFAPTGIFGLTRGYLGVTLKKIANKMEKEAEKEAEKEQERKKKKPRSKSPPTASRREVATSISAGRRSTSK